MYQSFNVEGLTNQPSLFDNVLNDSPRRGGKRIHVFVAQCTMVPPGYFLVAGENIRCVISGRKTEIQRTVTGVWRKGITLFETDESFHYLFDIVDDKLYDLVDLLFKRSIEYARAYGRLNKHCCKCNRKLELPRSRHYGIGPECEALWPDVVLLLDAELGQTWEQINESQSRGT